MTQHRHMIMGLPRSGKTTFLAAFWHVLDAGEIETRLILDKLLGNHEHLNSIVAAWRRCEEVPRTSMVGEMTVVVHTRTTEGDKTALLEFPDLSGESFERQLTTRRCKASYVDTFNGHGGILMFITADRALDGVTIQEIAPLVEPDEVPPQDLESPTPIQAVEWNPDLVPQQVRLVELLQFIQQPPFARRRRKLALIISAWDVLPMPRPTPAEWLARELPLLDQFLKTNAKDFEVRVYGLSAQGGNFRGDGRNALLGRVPAERIECVGPSVRQHDITEPVMWLMSEVESVNVGTVA